MKIAFRRISLILLLISSFLFSQKKYPSLLWEISGNGLKEKSYLYGTMHVSEKVAFNLSDVFFEKLYSVKQIALESDPELWLKELDEKYNNNNDYNSYNPYSYEDYYYGYNNYKRFYLNNLKTDSYKEALRGQDILADGILYRRYSGMQNFQENTYIDMFIYRSAKKLNKKFYGLEDIKESEELVKKSEEGAYYYYESYPKIKNKKIKELLKGKNIINIMEDAYRQQDLDLIEEISNATSTIKSRKYLLYVRNENMVKSMDSLMKKGSLFSAVGAAHLPGKYGIIEKLRSKGYTVTPLTGAYTEKGRAKKEQLDNTVYNKTLNTYKEHDGFSIQAPEKFFKYPSNKNWDYLVSLDIPNGAFLSVSKINHYNFLNKKDANITIKSIDSLLYENVPGKILYRKNIQNNGFSGIEVMSKLEQEEYVTMQIYVTPLQTYIFSLYGTKPYEDHYKNILFSSLKMDSYSQSFSNYEPNYGGYTIQLPDYRIIADTTNDTSNITGYDKNTGSYYFIKTKIFDDISPEKEFYELERLPYELGKTLNSKQITNKIIKEVQIPYSETKIELDNGENLYLKTIINGVHYNVAGIVTNDEKQKEDYFDSFQIKDFKGYKKTEKYTNKTAGYSINIPFKPKKEEEIIVGADYRLGEEVEDKADSTLEGEEEEITNFKLDNGQTLYISYYDYYPTEDSLTAQVVIREYVDMQYNSDSCSQRKIQFLKTGISANQNSYSDYLLKEDSIAQTYKLRYFFENGKIYEIKYIINSHQEINNPVAEEVLKNITFTKKQEEKEENNKEKEPLNSTEIIDNDEFFNLDIKFSNSEEEYTIENDSLIWKTSNINDQKILDEMKTLSTDYKKIEEYVLKLNEEALNPQILNKIIEVLNYYGETKPEFYLQLYPKFKNSGDAQFTILEKIAYSDEDRKYNKKIIELLKEYKPIPSSEYSLTNLLYFLETKENSENEILPSLLSLLEIEEYNRDLIQYLSKLISEDKLKANHIKKYKNYFYKEADKEIKRILNYNPENIEENYYNSYYRGTYRLKDFLNILSILNDSEYKKLISRIKETKNLSLIGVLGKIKKPVDLTQEEYLSLIKEIIPSKKLNQAYKEKFGKDLFTPEKDLTVDLAKNTLLKSYSPNYYDQSKVDSLTLREVKNLSYHNKEYKIFYFTVHKSIQQNDFYNNEEEEDYPEYNGEEITEDNEVNVGVIVFELTPEKEQSDLCLQENAYATSNRAYVSDYYSEEMDEYVEPMVRTVYSSTNLSYYDKEEWEKLNEGLIDYLKTLNHPRATSKFYEDQNNNYGYYY